MCTAFLHIIDFLKKNLFISLKGRVTEREGWRQRQRGFPSSGSLSRWPQQLGLGQAEARSLIPTTTSRPPRQKAEGRSPNSWAISHCFPISISGVLDWMWPSNMEFRNCTQQRHVLCYNTSPTIGVLSGVVRN